ncbi:hypothetical protein M231_06665 [Tremella mesenterica]|uniref:GH18 domain-containing protein n=1 Tax=Tremella mesenterica TaxID=5217 RepID=A0A4Q1BG36_TREME|nr:hypothetical protein M231_06665 [Tremella mesenterica]
MLSSTILTLVTLSLVAAGPHAFHNHGSSVRTVHHRRHHARNAHGLTTIDKRASCDTRDISDSCTYGAWQCQGTELQRCYNDKWNTVQDCTGADVMCSADESAIGCIWTWSLSDSNSTSGTTEPPDNSSDPSISSSVTSALPSITSNPNKEFFPTNSTNNDTVIIPSDDGSNHTSSSVSSRAPHGKGLHSTSFSSSVCTPTHTSAAPSSTSGQPTKPSNSTNNGGGNVNFDGPRFVVYADNWLNTMPDVSALNGYNTFVLAFWLSDRGASDDAEAWEQFEEDYREKILAEYHANGIALMVSAFGSTDTPTTSGHDPKTIAQDLAAWVKKYKLDGVDIDYEDFDAFNAGKSEAWLIELQTELRALLPQGQYIISHAPVAPWFTDGNVYKNGGYTKVNAEVGNSIDWYNIQFYNQGANMYTTCDGLINKSGSAWPHTSVFELNKYANVALNKILIGKPMTKDAAANG